MRPLGFLYPFQGKRISLTDIVLYYRNKGIDIDKNRLNVMIKEKTKDIERENITEEMLLDMIKTLVSQRTLATVDANFKTNCIKEFGQEFWDNLLNRKEKINNSRKFRNQMRVSKQSNKVGEQIIENKLEEQQNIEERN